MKKLILVLGIVASTFAFTSCGNSATTEAPAMDSTAVDTTVAADSAAVMVDSCATDSAKVVTESAK